MSSYASAMQRLRTQNGIPHWVAVRMDELTAEERDSIISPVTAAFARYIEAHEEPPRDHDADALAKIITLYNGSYTAPILRDGECFAAALKMYKAEKAKA